MKRYYYDLHLHSCLSPCGDEDNTPNNIAGMATLCELDIVALTDHNTSKNCPAFFTAAQKHGIVPIAGMELTTSEDIHVVCLFETLEDALAFDDYLDARRVKIKNRTEIFGRQTVLDENDVIIAEVEHLLTNATDVSIEEVTETVKKHKGVCYPAHIDRDSNGLIAVLGAIPPDSDFTYYELHNVDNMEEFANKYGIEKSKFIISSDAHYLTDMRDRESYFELEESDDPDEIRGNLFKLLRGEV